MRALILLTVLAMVYVPPVAIGVLVGSATASYGWAAATALAVYTVVGSLLLDTVKGLAK